MASQGENRVSGHGQIQRGWQKTDEDIRYWFIKALRRGDYDEALRLAPTADGLAEWPELQRREWEAWVQLTHRMKGQRDHEREARRKAGRTRRN